MGYIDAFRVYNQEPGQYTYWDQISKSRERNMGWRIDMFIVTEGLMPRVRDAAIYPEVMGSDHCPIELVIV